MGWSREPGESAAVNERAKKVPQSTSHSASHFPSATGQEMVHCPSTFGSHRPETTASPPPRSRGSPHPGLPSTLHQTFSVNPEVVAAASLCQAAAEWKLPSPTSLGSYLGT